MELSDINTAQASLAAANAHSDEAMVFFSQAEGLYSNLMVLHPLTAEYKRLKREFDRATAEARGQLAMFRAMRFFIDSGANAMYVAEVEQWAERTGRTDPLAQIRELESLQD